VLSAYIRAFARYSAKANEKAEDIGARRLHTVIEKVLEDISFNAPELAGQKIVIDEDLVKEKLADIAESEDSARYIL